MHIARKIALSAALAIAALSAGATAQNVNAANPNYGDYTLQSGFQPDPLYTEITAGGDMDASGIGSGCSGMVTANPDVRLRFTAGQYPLTFQADTPGDSTLIINAPDGRWYCDDDSAGNLNPRITFSPAQSGRYEVWVGNISGDGKGRLWITER